MVDTNVLLDWLLNRDTLRTELADDLFASAQELHIPDAIIIELAFALENFYELPRSLVSDNLHKVIDEPVFNCNRTLFYSRFHIEFRLSHSITSAYGQTDG